MVARQLTTYITGAYHSRFAIIPDYNVGVVVLSAGSGGPDAQVALYETVLADLLPGLEATARSQAEENLVGTYSASSSDVAMYRGGSPGEMTVTPADETERISTMLSANRSKMPWIGKSVIIVRANSTSTAASR